ncbi:hypothetical protein QOL99_11875 [Deinococcus sp. MIMF12]|uniref:Uncharacterized protein n=1 Tax=Deinococcus rhizophilus TaxID=3049544 RepID=A0ABT7JIF7_9DEIO|nr:hypothetical protein [Deinococcus rhizophilus]MDL2344845.1 hypothetical protein [Deinococcus rhizophilus]
MTLRHLRPEQITNDHLRPLIGRTVEEIEPLLPETVDTDQLETIIYTVQVPGPVAYIPGTGEGDAIWSSVIGLGLASPRVRGLSLRLITHIQSESERRTGRRILNYPNAVEGDNTVSCRYLDRNEREIHRIHHDIATPTVFGVSVLSGALRTLCQDMTGQPRRGSIRLLEHPRYGPCWAIQTRPQRARL